MLFYLQPAAMKCKLTYFFSIIIIDNQQEFKGRTLRVNSGPPPPREERPSMGFRSGGGGGGGGRSFDSGSRLYIGNLSWGVDNSALESLFSEQGKVMDAKVVYDRETGRSRGFGFVTYSTAEEANNAISSLDGSVSFLSSPLVLFPS